MAQSQVSNNQIESFVTRIEKLTEEKKLIADDIRDIFTEAKLAGFDVKAMREIIKRRAADQDKLREHDAAVEDYMARLGMLRDTPLGQAAIQREAADGAVPPP